MALAESHNLSIYDASILVSALEACCTVLYTEDMQHGQFIEGALTIRTPFEAGR